MRNLGLHLDQNTTPQTEPLFDRKSEMVRNNAGGYVFSVSPISRLRRFLVLGSHGGTYYASERKLTLENAENLKELFQSPEAINAVHEIVEVSYSGLAPKQDYAIFALAVGYKYGNREVRDTITENFCRVIRIGTHLFQFLAILKALGMTKLSGSVGRSIKKAIASWYNSNTPDTLAYQVLKYANRSDWKHVDVLNLSHVKLNNDLQSVGKYLINRKKPGYELSQDVPEIISVYEYIKSKRPPVKELASLITKHQLPRELIPTEYLEEREVWGALLPHMGLTALIRNLPKMTAIGLLAPLSTHAKKVAESIGSPDRIQKERIHPFQVLLALTTYHSGRGIRGNLSWTPVQNIVDALDSAFYVSFRNVESTGKNVFIGIDVSPSMTNYILGSFVTARQAAAVMAMLIARTEQNYHMIAFAGEPLLIDIQKTDSLATVCKKLSKIHAGFFTDCSLPMIYAKEHKLDVDAFVVLTDNETFYGKIHPSVALSNYRKSLRKPEAKHAVVAFTATECTIADPKDPNTMDFVGLDASIPVVLRNFILGEI